jgi:hypothetical protein
MILKIDGSAKVGYSNPALTGSQSNRAANDEALVNMREQCDLSILPSN